MLTSSRTPHRHTPDEVGDAMLVASAVLPIVVVAVFGLLALIF